ncbi:ABC transporter substrate-binding protein [Ferrimonas aestuarii]|uniref:Iron-siderophore ABC transporter substrate-binding protein n=1 Tax=Ferrimonas aestuarii TaxID=2569539 RepID=A0A4U1BHX4_9GAMM|nr:ABC transporter substrate-binding protein [Ferrimonas aestuarii]TKB50114.1 iron-siderophore ABC transporter substrate-binding protein [Ferrimonas aestuarii]
MKSRLLPLILLWFCAASWGSPTLPKRVVSLDYATTTTLIAMGLPPIAIADIDGYRRWVEHPRLPEHMVDLGGANEPNLELLAELKPDLILITPYQGHLTELLSQIAPVHSLSIYQSTGDAITKAERMTRELGQILGLNREAEALIADTLSHFEQQRKRLETTISPPLYMVRLHDDRHLWIYGDNSLGEATLQRLGIINAWQQPTNTWGFSAQSIDALNANTSASVLFLEPLPDGGINNVSLTPLWQHQTWYQQKRFHKVPVVLMFGALPSAQRMATLVVNALTEEAK